MSRTGNVGRVAQFLLGLPLGLLQLAAVIFFTITEPIKGGDWLIVVWGLAMSSSCAALALFVLRSARARSIAFALLAAQACFSLVKLTVYHESASLVILGITTITAATL